MLTHEATVIVIEQDEQIVKTITEIAEDITNGESVHVLSRDRSIRPGEVVNTRGSDSKDFVYVGTEKHNIILTPDHKLYDPVRKEWIAAMSINTSHHVLTSDKENLPVTSTHKIADVMSQRTLTLTVTPGQCFFANNILVHNER